MVETANSFAQRRAVIMYIGKTSIAPGYWIGVKYDEAVGKNDGSVFGQRYFECDNNYGGFVRPNLVKIDNRPPPKKAEKNSAVDRKANDDDEEERSHRGKKKKKGQSAAAAAAAAVAAADAAAAAEAAAAEAAAAEAAAEAEAAAQAAAQAAAPAAEEAAAPAPCTATSLPDTSLPGARSELDELRDKMASGYMLTADEITKLEAAVLPSEEEDANAAPAELASMPIFSETKRAGRKPKKRPPLTVASALPPDVMERMQPKQAWLTAGPHAMRVEQIQELMRTYASMTTEDAELRADAPRVARKNYELVLKASMLDKKRAAAEASYAQGAGLEASIVRQLGVFKVFAHDHEGNPRQAGGEAVAVAIRGTSNVRARLTDNKDGSYTCEYRAWVSGMYNVAIWLNGEPLGHSPYELEVLSTKADPDKCELRGPGLSSAISREPTSFEIEFVDAFGQVCYAEELDVYVELVFSPRYGLGSGPRSGSQPRLQQSAAAAEDSNGRSALQPEAKDAPASAGHGEAQAAADFKAAAAAPASSAPQPTSSDTGAGQQIGSRAESRSGTPAGQRASVVQDSPGKKSRRAQASVAPPPPKVDLTIETFLAGGGGISDDEMALKRRRPSVAPAGLHLLIPPSEYQRMDAIERQQHMQLWARRKATDQVKAVGKSESSSSTTTPANAAPTRAQAMARFADSGSISFISYDHELKADRKGCGFAYGGVSPGTLHAKGQLVRVHTVHYSIGLAGKYRLHVGLRQQSVALPGSPFEIEVMPGAAYAPSTRLPKESLPLRGVVGEKWRGMVIFAADKVGNLCIKGGAKVAIHVDQEKTVEVTCTDNGDGSYGFKWRSEKAGTYQIAVTIDEKPVVGSPTTLTMLPSSLAVGNCEVHGDGLQGAVAGNPAVLRITCKDQYSNLATPAPTLKFGLSLQQVEATSDIKEKRRKGQEPAEKLQEQRGRTQKDNEGDEARAQKRKSAMEALLSQSFEGRWVDGEYEIRYVAQNAGAHQLHLWADPEGIGERAAVPGSPYTLHVVENDAAPASSSIGYPVTEEKKNIYAGEKLTLKPQLRDQFGNPSAAPPEALTALLEAPDGSHELSIKPNTGKGVGTYEVSCESNVKGEYTLHVELNGQPIGGSPGVFMVLPSAPVAMKSKLLPPTTALFIQQNTELVLIAVDKLGNTLDRGGARVDARVLGPNASPVAIEDRKDGTYSIGFTAGAVGEYRVIARLDNVEMTPLALLFTEGVSKTVDLSRGEGKSGRATPSSLDQEAPTAEEVDGNEELDRIQGPTKPEAPPDGDNAQPYGDSMPEASPTSEVSPTAAAGASGDPASKADAAKVNAKAASPRGTPKKSASPKLPSVKSTGTKSGNAQMSNRSNPQASNRSNPQMSNRSKMGKSKSPRSQAKSPAASSR